MKNRPKRKKRKYEVKLGKITKFRRKSDTKNNIKEK